MLSCRYVGPDCSQIGDFEYDEVGQIATFSEQGFMEAILGGAAFIPAADFERIGFTSEELAAYGPVGVRVDPPQEFCEKLDKALQVFHDISQRMSREGQGLSVLADVAPVN